MRERQFVVANKAARQTGRLPLAARENDCIVIAFTIYCRSFTIDGRRLLRYCTILKQGRLNNV